MEPLLLRVLLALVLLVPSRCVLLVEDGAVPARLRRDGDVVRFFTAEAEVAVEVDAFRLRFGEPGAAPRVQQVAGGLAVERDGAVAAVGAVRDFDLRAGALVLRVDTPDGPGEVTLAWRTARTLEVVYEPPDPAGVEAFRDAWRLAEGERVYGLTTRLQQPIPDDPSQVGNDVPYVDDVFPAGLGTLDRRGESVEMFVRPTIALYTPFYHSSAGYGLYVDRATTGGFDLGATDPERLAVRFEAGTTPETQRLRTFLFLGPGHARIVDEYTALTGRPFRPPDWTFEHWRWRGELAIGPPVELDGVPINAQVARDLERYDRHGIPAGVYLIDRPWSEGEFGFENFRWDEVRLPNVEAMLELLADRGYEVTIWGSAWAFGDDPDDLGTEARTLGYLAPGSDRVVDLTNPDAYRWWLDQHVEFYARYDIAGVKLDRGEEFIPSEPTDVWADGRTGREVRNEYPNLQLELFHDALREARGDDFVVLTRSSWAGGQRWGAFWGGDTAGSTFFGFGPGTDLGLRSAIIGLQRAAFMGMPFWGSDTGGYYQFKQRDVFARWLQFSAFCPIMEIGGEMQNAPWDMPPGTAVECGAGPGVDCELIEIYRRYVQLHHDLIPYIAKAADEAATSGLPVARPLVFAYPDDPNVGDRWDEYLFGPDILVAPVWQDGARAREVYLPAGAWEDFWDAGVVVQGPATITVEAPLDVIPAFVRAGAEVPGR
ncbi:MAG: glycoside hydrolase family 31 protein [Myxococcota bacterium]|nr:glycoside hydrolase family 31 protein [Myxococcota bacterium]